MLRLVAISALIMISFIAGCATPVSDAAKLAAAGSTRPAAVTANSGEITPSPAYVTIAVDSTGSEPEFVQWARSNGDRIEEKDPNGDLRLFDSPGCRKVLVLYRRLQQVRMDVIAENVFYRRTTHDEKPTKQAINHRTPIFTKESAAPIWRSSLLHPSR